MGSSPVSPRSNPTDALPTTTSSWTPRSAATGLQQLLQFRRDSGIAASAADHGAVTACLLNAAAGLTKAAEAVSGLLELARMTAASGHTGKPDLN